MRPLRVFIGYDAREPLPWYVLAHSIRRRASIPVAFTPVERRLFTRFYSRKRDPLASQDFSDTRFLAPFLSGYEGQAVFMDCDQLMLSDIAELIEPCTLHRMLYVRKRIDGPQGADVKFLGQRQTQYPRKNWSSLMVMNCERLTAWSVDYVNVAPMIELHRFAGLPDSEIGDLPDGYNHLVGVDAPRTDAKHVHYTLGGPWFPEFADVEYAEAWRAELADMMGTECH